MSILWYVFDLLLQGRRWTHGLLDVELCVTEDGHQVVLRGRVPDDPEDDMRGKYVIQVRDAISGELTSQWMAQCQHDALYLYCNHLLASWSSNNTPYLARSCYACGAVHVYDMSRGKRITQYKQQGVDPRSICRGPGPDTLLLVDKEGKRILQLQWRGDSLQLIKQMQHNRPITNPDICYDGVNNNIYLAGEYTVSCIPLSGNDRSQPLWQLSGRDVDVAGQQLDWSLSVCCDPADRVYISERSTGRLLVVDGMTGDLLHVQSGMPG